MVLVLCTLSDNTLYLYHDSQVSYRFLVSKVSTLILARRRYFLPPKKGVLSTNGK